ncbi:MAG: hypothetical protein CFE21_06480 [Bacteroidetes bacterium B1(2017)]|nr:MAG: hypothetical protein CFE21_06480 [Bacteroidetes bacterium B1(2017)]
MKTEKPSYDDLLIRINELENRVAQTSPFSNEVFPKLNLDSDINVSQLSRDGISMANEQGIIIAWNSSMENLTGIKKQEAIGKLIWEVQLKIAPLKIRTPELAEILMSGFQKITQTKSFWQGQLYEQEIVAQNGEVKYIEDSSYFMQSEVGYIFYTFLRDVTDRKNYENAFIKKESLFRSLINASPDAIVTANLEGKIETLSPIGLAMFGFDSEEEIVGKPITDFIVELDRERALTNIQKMFEGVFLGPAEYIGIKKDGSQIDIEVNAEFIKDVYGNPEKFLLITRNISERKQTQLSLKISEEKYSKAFLSSPYAITISKLIGGQFVEVNDAFCLISGYTREETLANSTFSLDLWVDKKEQQFVIETLKSGASISGMEAKFKIKNGEIRTTLYSAQIIQVNTDYFILSSINDITERKNAEEALKESDARYRLVAENSNDVIWVMDPVTQRYKYISPTIYKLRGYTPEEIMSHGFKEALTPESYIRATNLLQNSIQKFMQLPKGSSLPASIEFDQPCKDGSIVFTEVNATLVRNEKDEIELIGVTRNIGDRKKVELENLKLARHFQAIIERAPDGIALISDKGEFKFVSPAGKKIFGFKPEEDTYGHPYENTHSEDLPAVLAHLDTILSNPNYVPTIRYRYRTHNNNFIWIESTFTNLLADPNVEAIVVNFKDIHESKLAQDELRKSKNQYDRLVSKIPIGVFIIHSDKVMNFKFVYMSPPMPSMLQVSEEKILADPMEAFKMVHPEDFESFFELNKRSFEKKIPFDWEGRIIINEELKWFHISSSPELLDDENSLWHGLIIDITERKLAQEERQKKNIELQKVIEDKDKFFSIVSHDLRGPLNGFLALTQMMMDELADLSEEEILKMVLAMKNSASNLFRLLENLLQWSKIQQGSFPFSPRNIQFHPFVEDCISMSMDQAKIKKISIYNTVPDGLEVFADGNMCQTIVRNLVSNSIKYTNHGGEIFIGANAKENKLVEITIRDTGIGMDQQIRDSLFFLKGIKTRKGTDGEPSTGLGLVLCKEFVEKHGGTIRAESEVGKGSTFTFTLKGQNVV